MPDDENYQINQHPWLILTTITPLHQPRPQTPMSLSRDDVQCGPPGLPRLTRPRQWQPGGMRDLLVVAITILPSPTFNPSLGTLSSQDSQALRTARYIDITAKFFIEKILKGSMLINSSKKDICKVRICHCVLIMSCQT